MKSLKKIYFVLTLLSASPLMVTAQDISIKLLEHEKIWSGTIKDGDKMPLKAGYDFNFYANNMSNQLQPLLLSNKGLYVWSEEPYRFEISDNHITISDNLGEVVYGREGSSLAEARKFVSDKYFPPSGNLPDEMLFSRPQYNTWIELTYNQNQQDVLKYAQAILDNGLPPGVIMIDDTWQEDYGLWRFHPGRFPEPKLMMDQLHEIGFKVMLWVCPFVSADQTLIYNELTPKKALLMDKTTETTTWETSRKPAMIQWWNGISALLDFSNPVAVDWFNAQLDYLVDEYDVDGFKLDAGDMNFYPANVLSMKDITPNEHCRLYAEIGLDYPLNEYRACWKMAGLPLVQRLHDKRHDWSDLNKLIPHMITEGLVGYTFSCPDMIGGGEFKSFLNLDTYDEDLVVRSAQCHALMPMMQFSVAPWRILSNENMDAIKKSVEIRMKYTPLIMELARASAKNGEPIMTNLEYYFPNQGFENIADQFMVGANLLVAPVITKGSERSVVLPKGQWIADDGKKYKGGKTYEIEVPLDRLLYFEKIK